MKVSITKDKRLSVYFTTAEAAQLGLSGDRNFLYAARKAGDPSIVVVKKWPDTHPRRGQAYKATLRENTWWSQIQVPGLNLDPCSLTETIAQYDSKQGAYEMLIPEEFFTGDAKPPAVTTRKRSHGVPNGMADDLRAALTLINKAVSAGAAKARVDSEGRVRLSITTEL